MMVIDQVTLPEGFLSARLNGDELRAAAMFLELARQRAPEVEVLSPRLTKAGFYKMVLRFPPGDTWELTDTLAAIADEVEERTGIFFSLD